MCFNNFECYLKHHSLVLVRDHNILKYFLQLFTQPNKVLGSEIILRAGATVGNIDVEEGLELCMFAVVVRPIEGTDDLVMLRLVAAFEILSCEWI